MAAAKKKKPARGLAVAHQARLADALADASWAEADEALAEALVEFSELKRALLKDVRGKEPDEASDALAMAAQALARAARRRGLSLFGDIGAIVAFDATSHELNRSPDAVGAVRIVREGVKRGRDVVIRAVVVPARKSAKRAAP